MALRILRNLTGTRKAVPATLKSGQFAFSQGGFSGSSGVNEVVLGNGADGASLTLLRYNSGDGALAMTADLAKALVTARSIALTGDVTGSANFDGSANASIAATVSITSAKVTNFDSQVRTSRLDQMAAPTATVSLNNQKIGNLAAPTAAGDAATKGYTDGLIQGLAPKDSVKAATTANITLSGTQTIDAVAVVAGDRVLVKNQTASQNNGIYVVAAGSWSRATDADAWGEIISAYTFVEQGTVYGDTGWTCTADAGGTLGTTAMPWAQFSGAADIVAGAGLTKTGVTLDIGQGAGILVGADDIALTGQALALHNLGTSGIFVRTGAGTVAARSVAVSGSGISAANGDGVAGNPTISLTTALSTVGGLTPATDRFAYYTGAATAALGTITAAGRALNAGADATAQRNTLGLDTMATQAASAVNITGGTIAAAVTFDDGTF